MGIILAAVAGLFIGVVMGTLGAGGGILSIPVLIYVLGMPPHEATTASMVIVGISSLVSALEHTRRGNVRWREGVIFGLIGIVGTTSGAFLARGLNDQALLLGFAALLLVVATLMWRGAGKPAKPATGRRPHPVAVALTAVGAGVLTGIFGVGGGFAIVPALVLVLGFDMTAAVGTSLLVIAINSASALGVRLIGGVSLDWPVIATYTVTAIVGSLVGAGLTGRLPARTLKRAFAVLLLLVAVYTGVNTGLALLG